MSTVLAASYKYRTTAENVFFLSAINSFPLLIILPAWRCDWRGRPCGPRPSVRPRTRGWHPPASLALWGAGGRRQRWPRHCSGEGEMIQAFFSRFSCNNCFLNFPSHDHILSTISEANDVCKRLNIWIDYRKFILKCRQLCVHCNQLLLTPGSDWEEYLTSGWSYYTWRIVKQSKRDENLDKLLLIRDLKTLMIILFAKCCFTVQSVFGRFHFAA